MELTCNGCGNQFEAQRKDARYCSPRCRTRAHRARVDGDKPKAPRTPLAKSFSYAVWPIYKKSETLVSLLADDRFKRNRSEIARMQLHWLKFARDRLDEAIAALEE